MDSSNNEMILVFFPLLLLLQWASAKQDNFCFNNGKVIADSWGDGSTYLVCENNRLVRRHCAPDYRFDKELGFCVFKPPLSTSRTTSAKPPTRCVPGSRTPNPRDDTTYFECNWNGEQYNKRFCQPGAVYEQSATMCINRPSTTTPTTTTTRRHPTTTTTPFHGPCKESAGWHGYKPDVHNCGNFYQCAQGRWVQMKCAPATMWSQKLLVCVHNDGSCVPRPYPPAPTVAPYPPGPYPYPDGPPAPPPDYYHSDSTTSQRPPIEV